MERKQQQGGKNSHKLLSSRSEFISALRGQFYLLGNRQKAMMEWKHLKQSKGQTIKNFIEEFRKQTLSLNVPLETSEMVMKCIGYLHNYLHHSFLLFEPKSINEASVKVLHIENWEKHEKDDHSKRTTIAKRREARPSCTHYDKKGCDEDNYWKRI